MDLSFLDELKRMNKRQVKKNLKKSIKLFKLNQ